MVGAWWTMSRAWRPLDRPPSGSSFVRPWNDQRLVGAGNLVIKEEVAGQHNQDQVLAGVIPGKTGCRRDHHFVNLHVDVLLVNVFGVVGFRSDQVGRLLFRGVCPKLGCGVVH